MFLLQCLFHIVRSGSPQIQNAITLCRPHTSGPLEAAARPSLRQWTEMNTRKLSYRKDDRAMRPT